MPQRHCLRDKLKRTCHFDSFSFTSEIVLNYEKVNLVLYTKYIATEHNERNSHVNKLIDVLRCFPDVLSHHDLHDLNFDFLYVCVNIKYCETAGEKFLS